MAEIQKQICLYQYLEKGCFSFCILCLAITIWMFFRIKRNEKWRIISVLGLFLIAGCFMQQECVQGFTDERIPVILKMKDGEMLKYSKIYDGNDFRVFHNPETEDEIENINDIQILGIEKQDEVFIKEIEGIMEDSVKDVTEGEKVSIILTKVELEGKDAQKYRVDLENEKVRLNGSITIKKRKINLKIEGGTREYGHYNEITYETDTPVQEDRESYVNNETEGLLENEQVLYPTPCEKEIEKENMPDYPLGEWEDRITVNRNGDAGANYYFNYEGVSCGNLVIREEEIKESSQYVDFETNKTQVYISENPHKLWVDGEIEEFRVLLKENIRAGFYTDVCTETGEIISQNGEGLDFSRENFQEGEERKLSVYLYNRNNKAKSQTFEISVFIDCCAPQIVKNTVSDNMYDYEKMPEKIIFHKFYSQDRVKEEFQLEDKEGSGVKRWFYHVMGKKGKFTKEEIRKYITEEIKAEDWKKGDAELNGCIELPKAEKNYIIFIKAEDNLGHTKIYVSDGIMTDRHRPEIEIKVDDRQKIPKTGIYGEDIELNISVQDRQSAVAKVEVCVTSEGEETGKETLFRQWSLEEREESEKIILSYKINAQKNNSNDVCVRVTVLDYAGNEAEKMIYFKIDTDYPEISVKWDTEKPQGKGYYNIRRTAEVEVKDRNFDATGVKFDIKGNARIGKWKADGWRNKCRIIFEEDGEYQFSVSCMDGAGNVKKYEKTESFVIDRMRPVIEVSYNYDVTGTEKYFNRERVATVVIKEKNFDENQVKILTEGDGKGPVLTEFSTEKDLHKAKICYQESGEYILNISCTDRAGNQSEEFQSEKFCVDLDIPEIIILNLRDKSANRDTVAPFIQIRDLNYQMGGFAIDITGSNNKKLDVKKTVKRTKQGESIQIADFPREAKADDIYKLSVTAVDKAGNWAKKVIEFSVNRCGSIYMPDLDTQSWLSTDGKNHTYIREGKDIGILEYNIDLIKERTLTINRDGELKNLKAGIDYTVEELGKEGKWEKNYYKIKAENFRQEGNYTIILNSRDMADNIMNNAEVLPISFTVDKTPPTIILSGIEGDRKYQTLKKDIVIDIKDNLALEETVVKIGDRETTYGREELKAQDGIIKEVVLSKDEWQNIEVIAKDAADNITKMEKMKVLIMPNSFIREEPKKNFEIIFGIIAAGGFLFVWKKKRSCFILNVKRKKG